MDEATLQTTAENSSLAGQVHGQHDRRSEGQIAWLVADAIYAVAKDGTWQGSVDALLLRLRKRAPKRRRLLEGWPASAEHLLLHLQTPRLIAYLRRAGITVRIVRTRGVPGLEIRIVKSESPSTVASPAEPDEQWPLFTAEELMDCARAAQGKRWRE
jgi:hypothetical protein